MVSPMANPSEEAGRGARSRPPARRTTPARRGDRRRSSREALDVYLGELSGANPLTREQEVVLARRIESAQHDALVAVLDAGVALVELMAWRDATVAGALPRKQLIASEQPDDHPYLEHLERAVAHEQKRHELAAQLSRSSSKRRRAQLSRAWQREVTARNEAVLEVGLRRNRAEEMVQRVADEMRTLTTAASLVARRPKSHDGREARIVVEETAVKLGRGAPDLVDAWRPMARALRRADRAKTELTSANLRLVVSFAKRFVNRGVPLDDLIQEGNIGLMRAVEKFDHRVGTKFSTYASWWLRQAMQRAIMNQGRTVRLPVHVASSKASTARARQRLAGELGRAPDIDELAERMGTTVDALRQLFAVGADSIPFDMPVSDNNGLTLSECLPDTGAERPDDVVELDDQRAQARKMLETLTAREQRILRMRFGIGGFDPHTLADIGRDLGLTRERIRQIEGRALEKLRRIVERYVD